MASQSQIPSISQICDVTNDKHMAKYWISSKDLYDYKYTENGGK